MADNFLKHLFTQALPKRKCRQKSVKEKRREVLFFRAKRIMPTDLLNFKFVLFAFKYRKTINENKNFILKIFGLNCHLHTKV